MTDDTTPGLFGLQNNTNRDFRLPNTWGKNQFNSSFPTSLCCYLHSKGIKANYLCFRNNKFGIEEISIQDIFSKDPTDEDIFFAFESIHTPFNRYVIGNLPRTDLVIQEKKSGICLSGLEIKLTALPDNTTCNSTENLYGSEIVVRPDTIVYLACSIAASLDGKLGNILPSIAVSDWSNPSQVLLKASELIEAIDSISISLNDCQSPFLLQPIWKTKGKSPELSENCLDLFVWSNAGFCNFISHIAKSNGTDTVSRQMRTVVWLFKMLDGIKKIGQFDHELIIDSMSFNNRNDKAFASSGNITNRFMYCERLTTPILKKEEIKNIILGGGQNLLSPERRFDAIIYNSPELFK